MTDRNLPDRDDRTYLERLAEEYGLDTRSSAEDFKNTALKLIANPETRKHGLELAIGREIPNYEYSRPPINKIVESQDPEEVFNDIREYDSILQQARRFSRKFANDENIDAEN